MIAPPRLSQQEYKKLSKRALIQIILDQQSAFDFRDNEQETKITKLTEEIDKLLVDEFDRSTKDINNKTNEPSSKKAEWDKDGDLVKPKSGTKKPRKKKRKKRTGCGNKSKSSLEVDEINVVPLDTCPDCNDDLKNKTGRDNAARIIEDIAPPAKKTTVFKEITESKWCKRCKKMVSSTSEKALPGSDIGLNATIELAYLWVMCSLSLPNIQAFFQAFKASRISTAGIVKMMIRLSDILQPVYEEIRNDVKHGMQIYADETGWRVNGDLWWLWIFANKRTAYYWPDKSRGSAVVTRVLGGILSGILVVDAWHAYNQIVCEKQTCMAHIFRKIRKYIETYPEYRSVLKFYLQLRKIIRDGEKLQTARPNLEKAVFQRRLKKLKKRLHLLLAWKNPNFILEEVIKKVRRQEKFILTFIEYAGVEHHNNFGEFIIKKGILKRKVSGGSKSEKGFAAYACLQSIVMTCQLRNISFSHFMKETLVQYIRTGKPMLLSEYERIFGKNESENTANTA